MTLLKFFIFWLSLLDLLLSEEVSIKLDSVICSSKDFILLVNISLFIVSLILLAIYHSDLQMLINTANSSQKLVFSLLSFSLDYTNHWWLFVLFFFFGELWLFVLVLTKTYKFSIINSTTCTTKALSPFYWWVLFLFVCCCCSFFVMGPWMFCGSECDSLSLKFLKWEFVTCIYVRFFVPHLNFQNENLSPTYMFAFVRPVCTPVFV